jgi:hypothetical protein
MKIYSFIALAILACGLCCTKAQSTNTGPSTNLVLTATLNLTAYIQNPTNGGPQTVSIRKYATKDIVAALETELGLPTNDLATARLVIKWVGLGGTNFIPPLICLRTSAGDTNVNYMVGTNVNDTFRLTQGNTSFGNVTVNTLRSNTKTGTSTETDYSLLAISMNATNAANLVFQVQGQAKISLSSVTAGKTLVDARAFPASYSIAVTGSGTVGTNSAVFSGTFTAGNRKVEQE